MKIWLINHYAVPPKYYPLARQYNFAKYLLKMGHEVLIIAASTVHNSDINMIEDDSYVSHDTYCGVDYLYVRCKTYKGNGIKRIYNMCEFAIKLPGVCKKLKKPDAIIATSMPPMSCAMGIRLAKKYGCKGIAEIADLWPETLIAYGLAKKESLAVWVLRRLEKWIYTHCDKIVFTMEGAYDYIVEQGWEKEIPRSKVEYVNNGVDLDEFDINKNSYVLEDKDLDDERHFKVVYVGSIRKVNNVGLLIDTAKMITNPRVKFLIWGDGEEKDQLTRRVIDEKIENVSFKGRVDKRYIPGIVSRADLNIAHNGPSDIFRFGISFNKIFDYMAAGKPILADFPSQYNPIVINKCGFDVEHYSSEAIASEVERLANMSAEELKLYGTNSRQTANKYDSKKLTEQIVDIILGIEKVN